MVDQDGIGPSFDGRLNQSQAGRDPSHHGANHLLALHLQTVRPIIPKAFGLQQLV